MTLNKSQAHALNRLRGLPERAHMMVMCSSITATGGTLEGDEAAFEELVSHISEDLAHGMHSATTARALYSLSVAIDPESENWLGM